LSSSSRPPLRSENQSASDAGKLLMDVWPAATPALRGGILAALLRRPDGMERLADAIDARSVNPRDVDPGRRVALVRASAAPVAARLTAAFGSGSGPSDAAQRSRVVESYLKELPASGDAATGAAVFAERCASCHRLGGEGHDVGPDLDGAGKKTREELVASILDPKPIHGGWLHGLRGHTADRTCHHGDRPVGDVERRDAARDRAAWKKGWSEPTSTPSPRRGPRS
jgi:mono/diheme cytochrome c family protein